MFALLVIAVVAAIFFAFVDAQLYERKLKIMHGLGLAVRALVLAAAANQGTDGEWPLVWACVAMAGAFGLVFRPMFNLFAGLDLEWMGTTAQYDKLWRWVNARTGQWLEPSWLAAIFEALLLVSGMVAYFAAIPTHP